MAVAARTQPVPESVALKPASQFELIGKPVKRVDTPAKVNGSTRFGIDVMVEGMRVAAVAMCPTVGGRLRDVDDRAARAVPGVVDVLRIDDAVAVVGENYWSARQGLDLATLGPVAEPAPANDLDFPFNQRRIMRGWNLLFLRDQRFQPEPAQSAAWNQGAYLVRGLAHCGECHTPRNVLFATKLGESLSGGTVDGWQAWNITPDKATGLGRWTDDALISYLHSGCAPGHGAATGSMREAIDLSLSRLPASDIEAIVLYLRSLAPDAIGRDAAVAALPATVRASGPWSPAGDTAERTGKRIFEAACASCHAWNGTGQQTRQAGLAGAHALSDPTGTNLVRVIVHGSSDSEKGIATTMPAFGAAYTDAEIAAVANYAIAHFGGKQGQVTSEQVARLRQ